MCVPQSRRLGLDRWNWDGEQIVHKCIVPSKRPIPGAKRRTYDIDVREFLVTKNNEVVKRTIDDDLKTYIIGLPGGDWDKFRSRAPGSFDHRAYVVASFVSERIRYRRRRNDPWLFPDETMALGDGDCEDRALLAASLLLAAGVSSFNVRVALGKVVVRGPGRDQGEYDHVWVMYKTESGRWTVLEPIPAESRQEAARTAPGRGARTRAPACDYVPHFLFNDCHLWAVGPRRGMELRSGGESLEDLVKRDWKRLDPLFVGHVHKSILEEALSSLDAERTERLLRRFHRPILGFLGPIVDDVDRRAYDPIEHFDNGYIDEGWKRVEALLRSFQSDNAANLLDFALAAHAIADFYSHSSYAEFVVHKGGSRPYVDCYVHGNSLPGSMRPPRYTGGTFDLTSDRFTVNPYYWKKRTKKAAAEQWEGKIISGRYAQEDDTQGGLLDQALLEGTTWIPERYLEERDFWVRGSLPHHNEIAVDDAVLDRDRHMLYRSETEYALQFKIRKNTAIRHIQKAFLDNLRS